MKHTLPPRRALGINEAFAIVRCISHYYSRGLDPGYEDYYEGLYTGKFVEFMGIQGYADAVSSGCASLYIAIKALALPTGSLVATSPITDASVIGCIVEQGHIPYLIDSKAWSYNISVDTLKERFNSNIRALIITHAGGEPCEMPEIVQFCKVHGIEIIEDCSQAIGAIPQSGDLKVGSYGRFGCYSTMYRKNLSASGSSGLIFATNFDDYKLAKQHADRGKKWWNKELVDMRDPGFADFPGLNWNSDEIRCAIGYENLKRLSDTNLRRNHFLRNLLEGLKVRGIKKFKPYAYHEGFAPFYFPFFVDTEGSTRTVIEVSENLRDQGIGIGVKYGCLVSTWEWAKPYMYDKFNAPNATHTRDNCFHLYLNERYGRREVKVILDAFTKHEVSFH